VANLRVDVVMVDRKVEETEGHGIALRNKVEELRERESTRALTIEMGQMQHLVNGLTGELGG